jgi:DNA-binding NtrC family response regulator
MRLDDLDLRELLAFEPKGGVLRFAGRRALIMDALALGILRKELIDTVGATVARGILTRFGYVHGWRSADAMHTAFPWDSEREWQLAGGRLHMLQGQVVFEPPRPVRGERGERGERGPLEESAFAEGVWRESYEAEQHLLHMGRSDEPACFALVGFASGWLSHVHGREIVCIEDQCVAKGDPECHFIGKPREAWGDEVAKDIPFYSRECMEGTAKELCETLKRTERAIRRERKVLARVAGTDDEIAGLIVRSEAMHKVVELARRVAKVDTTVLITGESGVGKERIARLIHDESPRRGGGFLAVNCGAVTETLLESELFGHARGSFSGASSDRVGLFEAANGGTLLLDEIGEITPAMQVKLLRALQEREVRRVGETKSRPIDVRVLGATNRNLGAEVAAGRFREDLYYRLRVIELSIPPLRARKDDILPLARAILARTARRFDRKIVGFTPQAAERLRSYAWPGNVRELENAIESAVVLCDGSSLDIEQLPGELVPSAVPAVPSVGTALTLEEVERRYILSVLDANGGNRTKTAAELAIGQATLYRNLKEYGVASSESARGPAARSS